MTSAVESPRISDALWARLAPIIDEAEAGSTPGADSYRRMLLNAILYRVITGEPWEGLPAELPHDLLAQRSYRRWQRAGILSRLSEKMLVSLEVSRRVET